MIPPRIESVEVRILLIISLQMQGLKGQSETIPKSYLNMSCVSTHSAFDTSYCEYGRENKSSLTSMLTINISARFV